MDYKIIEKQYVNLIYFDSENIKTICEIADRIDENFRGMVMEVRHNRLVSQGVIFLRKESSNYLDKIEIIIT